MTVKFIGAVIICIASTYFGIKRSNELKGRFVSLKNIASALEQLETEIAFSANDLRRAFINISKTAPVGGLFKDAAEKIEEYGIKKAWSYAVLKNNKPLTEADRELILTLSAKLGMTDTKNQLKHIGYVKELIKAQSCAAENEYRRLGKIYSSGGLLVGVFIILVII